VFLMGGRCAMALLFACAFILLLGYVGLLLVPAMPPSSATAA
jgi:hypothetical protein